MSAPYRPVVAVIGGGIAGLSAAWELVGQGQEGKAESSDRARSALPEVHVFEADARIGGKLLALHIGDRIVDVGADAFVARRPEATELCGEIGIAGDLVPVGAQGASIWARGKLRLMPAGLNLGVPTQWWPLARSGILSFGESLRAARDLTPFRSGPVPVAGDESVGAIVRERLGRPILERLVDPLVGGIHAGTADQLSAASTFPLLIAAGQQPGSLMRGLRRPVTTPSGPLFMALASSTASLAGELAAALVDRGVTIHTGCSVETLQRGTTGVASDQRRWMLHLGGGEQVASEDTGPRVGTRSGPVRVDAVIIAVPAHRAAVLLAEHAPRAAGALSTIEYGSVAVITLVYPEMASPMAGTGVLVPRATVLDGRRPLVTGVTFLSRKWPHLAEKGHEIVRASVGRFGDDRHARMDDDELVGTVVGELDRMLDLHRPPLTTVVTRWKDAFPQYRPGHLDRVGLIDEQLAALDGVAMAGSALSGVGIPACIASGRSAARSVLARRSGRRPPVDPVPPTDRSA
ncbi:MAG: protoporphyrinogen oxidase [Acidimicrobiales bacterium]